jgi:hypothetical protein
MSYKGETQKGPFYCVFASVGPAVNSVAGKDVWTQDALLDDWRKKGIVDADLHFRNIYSVAIQPVKSDVNVEHHEDGPIAISGTDYLKMIRKCVDGGGVAIVSLEHADLAGSKLNRKKRWHMLSLIGRKGDVFDAWDTAVGKKMTVTAHQLVSHVPYGGGVLAVHEKHDVLLIQPAVVK